MLHRALSLILLLSPMALLGAAHINVLMYHRIDDTAASITSVTSAQFTEHLDKLAEEGFQVLSLERALTQLQQGTPLPNRAVAITFDDAHVSIYQHAFPILRQRQLPFTVFINTNAIDKRYGKAMNWDMLRQMKAAGVTVANHTVHHNYLVRTPGQDALNVALNEIEQAQQRLEQELGPTPKWLAYPYGEYSQPLKRALAEQGWLAFGQHSGGIASYSDFQALPRFPAAGIYANWSSLRTKLLSQPMPLDYVQLPESLWQAASAPVLRVTLHPDAPVQAVQLRCYIQGEAITPQWQDASTFSVQATKPLAKGRTRYNCTAPSQDGGFYYWLSQPWINP